MPVISEYLTDDSDPECEIYVEMQYTVYPSIPEVIGTVEVSHPAEGGPEASKLTIDGEEVEMWSTEWAPITEVMLGKVLERLKEEMDGYED